MVLKNAHFIIGFLLLVSCQSTSERIDKPNIVIFLIDDAGYADFGFMGSKDLLTPNIDELAEQGVIFTDGHTTASVCAPSRAGLITGKYQQRFGFECNIPPVGMGLDPQEKTLADRLKEVGYHTIAIGKWHLGETDEYHPKHRGFDDFYGFLGGARSYFPYPSDQQADKSRLIEENGRQVSFQGYLTDVFGDKAVEYIDQHKEQPFFLYLSFNAVHTPMEARKDHLEKFRDHPRKMLAAMTWSLDENIGKVVNKLKKEEIFDNTLFFFLSDNGGAHNNQSSCLPLKGWKGNKFEGGHRIPFFMSWPENVEGGKSYAGLTSAMDIFATSVSAAGINPEELAVDGVNLIPYITGKDKDDPHDNLFWRKDKMAAVRNGSFKLIRLEDYGYVFYDLSNDLGEKNDLQETFSQQFSTVKNALENWEKDKEEPGWYEDENWNRVNYEIHKDLMNNRPVKFKNPNQMKAYYDQEK